MTDHELKQLRKDIYHLYRQTANLNLYLSTGPPDLKRVKSTLFTLKNQIDQTNKTIHINTIASRTQKGEEK